MIDWLWSELIAWNYLCNASAFDIGLHSAWSAKLNSIDRGKIGMSHWLSSTHFQCILNKDSLCFLVWPLSLSQFVLWATDLRERPTLLRPSNWSILLATLRLWAAYKTIPVLKVQSTSGIQDFGGYKWPRACGILLV